MPRGERPHEASAERRLFDRFAERASIAVSRAPFFAFCALLVVVWLPSYFAFGNADTWQLIINTITTIVTFLLVALLQNSQTRSNQAIQKKLNAIAEGLARLLDGSGPEPSSDRRCDAEELLAVIGLEHRESA